MEGRGSFPAFFRETFAEFFVGTYKDFTGHWSSCFYSLHVHGERLFGIYTEDPGKTVGRAAIASRWI